MDMPLDSSPVASPTPRKRRNHRPAPKRFDGRYALGRRVRELVELFTARIGPDADDKITATAIRRAAETTALSEHLRARMLRGEVVSADDVLRASRTADLLTRRLLERAKPRPSAPSLSSYLAERTHGEDR
jgi:hypothetical protein